MIWRVTIELTMYVEADTEDEAHEVAESSAWKEAQNGVEFMHANGARRNWRSAFLLEQRDWRRGRHGRGRLAAGSDTLLLIFAASAMIRDSP